MKRLITLWAVCIALTVAIRLGAEELGVFERGSVEAMLSQNGHKDADVISGDKSPQTDPNDGTGWIIVAKCVKGNRDYIAILWFNKTWTKGRLIVFKAA